MQLKISTLETPNQVQASREVFLDLSLQVSLNLGFISVAFLPATQPLR